MPDRGNREDLYTDSGLRGGEDGWNRLSNAKFRQNPAVDAGCFISRNQTGLSVASAGEIARLGGLKGRARIRFIATSARIIFARMDSAAFGIQFEKRFAAGQE